MVDAWPWTFQNLDRSTHISPVRCPIGIAAVINPPLGGGVARRRRQESSRRYLPRLTSGRLRVGFRPRSTSRLCFNLQTPAVCEGLTPCLALPLWKAVDERHGNGWAAGTVVLTRH